MSDLEILLISLGVLFVAPYLFIFLLGILPIGKGLAHGPYKKVVNLWYGTTEDGYCYTDLRLFYVYGSLSLVPEEWREAPVINAVAPVINRNCTILKVVFRARVCENETVYFITDDQYKKICSRGRLLGQVMPLPDYKKNRFGYKKDSGMYNLVEESKFKLFGYNVSAKDDYSARYRQTVLMFMIESGLTNKYELLKHIDFNVSNHAHLRSNWLAVTKWEADRQFVSDYSYGSRPIHWVTTSNPPTVEAVYDDYDYQTNGSQSTSQVSTAGSRSSSNSTGQRKSNQQRPKNNAAEVRASMVRPSGLTAYSVGQRVEHKAFGPGVVTRIDERSNDIYIRFGNEEKMFGLHTVSKFLKK